MTMEVIYVGRELPNYRDATGVLPGSIFLAGPTPRDREQAESWRPEALTHLRAQKHEGVVFVPETEDGLWLRNYEDQVLWEWDALGAAACVLFWVPRELQHMPGFTTNVEFGVMAALRPERTVLGAPLNTPKIRYLHFMSKHAQRLTAAFNTGWTAEEIPHATSLRSAIVLARQVATGQR